MSRYIDADLIEYHPQQFFGSPYGGNKYDIVTRSEVEKIPTADVTEIKHGYWADDDTCSVCGVLGEYTKDIYHEDYYFNYSPYCSHCGSKMDGEAE